jgi:RNA polymerase sigma factor (sigma-70 family)
VEHDLNALVTAAQNGSREALEEVISYAQGYIYNLALRMLQLPLDAEDATQEILINLITHLGQFRGESSFSTWMYRIASNHLLNARLRDREKKHLTFEGLSLRLEESLASRQESIEDDFDSAELTEEVRRNCTLGMLMCLNRQDRLALILGEVLELNSDDAAQIMETTPTAYRKRLSRARQSLISFVSRQCGIANPASPCRCEKHVRNKIQAGLLDPANLNYQQPHDSVSAAYAKQAQQTDEDNSCRTVALLRSHPAYTSRRDFVEMLEQIFESDNPDS